MIPRLFDLPILGLPVNSYGVAIMLGFVLAMVVVGRRAQAAGVNREAMLEIGVVSLLLGMLGGKLNYLLQYPGNYSEPGKLSVWGDFKVSFWGAAIGGLVPLGFWLWERSKRDPARRNAIAYLLLGLASALVLGRAVHLGVRRGAYSWMFLRALQSGFVLYGGLIGGTVGGLLYTRFRKKLPVGRVIDLAAAPVMLALSFGRLGCFLNGCCYGREGQGFPCVSFPPGSPAAIDQGLRNSASRPVHPSQLYEAFSALLLFGILSWAWRRRRPPEGSVFLLMAALYSAWRFSAEFLRGDERPIRFGLSYSQWVSVAVLLLCVPLFALMRRRVHRRQAASEQDPRGAN